MSQLGARSAKDRWVLPGAAMGVSAGMIFVTFQMVAATAFGYLLWMVNFALVAQGALTQFPAASPVVQFIAHTFFFGTVLALMLGVRLRSEEPARVQVVAGGMSRDLDLPRAS